MPSSDWPDEWRPHGPNCFCRRCTWARKRAARRPAQPHVVVYADETAAHIRTLVAAGWSQRKIARAAGVSLGVVNKATKPERVIDVATAEKILAVS